jgi:hypothetical protein
VAQISQPARLIKADEPIAGLVLADDAPTRKPSSVTITPSAAEQNDLDPRLVFLERAAALRILIKAGELSVDEAFDQRLMPAIYKFADCRCYREILEGFDRWDDDHRSRHHDHEGATDHGRADCSDGWLRGLARAVATASEGDRNSILFWAACRGSEAVRDGKAAEGFVNNVLLEAAKRCGLSELEAKRTIKSGMRRT